MSNLFTEVLIARIKSWLWRAFGVGVIAVIGALIDSVAGLDLPTITVAGVVSVDIAHWLTVGLGLVLGEVTKYFNVNRPWLKSQGL